MYKYVLIFALALVPISSKANSWVSFTNTYWETVDAWFYTDETKTVELTFAGLSLNQGEWTAVYMPEIVYYKVQDAAQYFEPVEGWLAGIQPDTLLQIDPANGINMMAISYHITVTGINDYNHFWLGFTFTFCAGLLALGARWVRKIVVDDTGE